MNKTAVPEKTTTQHRSVGPHARWLLLLAMAGLFALWVGAQYLAYRFAYHPNLGPSVLEIPEELHGTPRGGVRLPGTALFFLVRPGHRTLVIPFATTAGALVLASLGPLYSPLQFLRWASVYRPIPELTPVVSEGILVVAISTIATATNALVVLSRRPRRTVSSSHGSARWGSGEPLGEPEGLLIGRGLHDRELFRFNGEGHLRSWPGVATRLQVCTRPTSTMWTGSAPPSRPRAKQNSGCGRRWRSSASRRSTAREDADATART